MESPPSIPGRDGPSRWQGIGLTIAAWSLLGTVLSVELYFNTRAGKMNWQESFSEIAAPQFVRAAMWACLTPCVLALRTRVPLRSGRWFGGIGFHLGCSFAVMALYYLGRMGFYYLFFGLEGKEGFWKGALRGFYGHNLVDMACYWAVIAFGYGSEIQRKFKGEELRAAVLETRLIEAELKALREQLRPHFLFNTLNTVSVLVRENRNDEAVTLLARLGSLLRMSLDGNRDHETTLRQEMDFLERYVEIQKARFSDRLSVGIQVDPGAFAAKVPHLILQPLVENAILHGIAPKSGPGRVDIRGWLEGQSLSLEVADDGPGRKQADGQKEGIGLSNTRERLAKIYGDKGRLVLANSPSGGFVARIEVPFHT